MRVTFEMFEANCVVFLLPSVVVGWINRPEYRDWEIRVAWLWCEVRITFTRMHFYRE